MSYANVSCVSVAERKNCRYTANNTICFILFFLSKDSSYMFTSDFVDVFFFVWCALTKIKQGITTQKNDLIIAPF